MDLKFLRICFLLLRYVMNPVIHVIPKCQHRNDQIPHIVYNEHFSLRENNVTVVFISVPKDMNGG